MHDLNDLISRSDTISRSALLQHGFFVECEDGFYASVVKSIDIRNAPAVDAVKVVRCKDCQHTGIAGTPPLMFRYCRHPKGLTAGMLETDFCPYGERRADDG